MALFRRFHFSFYDLRPSDRVAAANAWYRARTHRFHFLSEGQCYMRKGWPSRARSLVVTVDRIAKDSRWTTLSSLYYTGVLKKANQGIIADLRGSELTGILALPRFG
jgi:hypothetical protein